MLDDLSFIKKVKQTVTWSKLVRFEYEIRQRSSIKSESLKSKDNEDVVVAMGSDVYQVVWQHQISTKNNIRNAKVIDVNYIGDFNKLEH
jgi:glutamine cyclotransferase